MARPTAGGAGDLLGLRIQMLGGFHVWVGERLLEANAWKRRKAGHLVKLVALAPHHQLHVEQLQEWLWPEQAASAAGNNLRQTLYVARRTLEPTLASGHASPYLVLQGDQLVLSPAAPLWIDVEAFEAAQAIAQQTAPEPGPYQAALALYAGELLPEDRYADWLNGRREALHQAYCQLLIALAGVHEQRGELLEAIAVWQRVISSEPTYEPGHRALMRLYARTGQRHQSLGQYHRLQATMRRELDAEPEAASRQLYQAILAHRGLPEAGGGCPHQAGRGPPPLTGERAGPPERAPNRSSALPNAPTSFIGREAELAEVTRLLATTQLLTLTGTGGIGKTRLALQVATAQHQACPAGVAWAELAALSAPELVLRVVATALGIQEQPGQPLLDTLLQALRARHLVLVLDNCEHLLDACAQLADALLHCCPHVRLLTTSREPLGLVGETLYRVPPLALPPLAAAAPEQHLLPITPLAESEAVRLFSDRVVAVQPSFQVNNENARAVAQICHQLEGIPLALELVAARVRTLPVEVLAQQLDARFWMLTGRSRAALPRHRTLRAALDWSYGLLSSQERRLLARVSVFASGWTLQAAEAVCAGGGISAEAVFELLLQLVDKSLAQAAETARPEGRYRLLEPVRRYAADQLRETGEESTIRDRHLAYYLELAVEAEQALSRPEGRVWLEQLDTEHDNLRAALAWSQLAESRADMGLRLAGALYKFWATRGYFTEGRRWLEGGLAVSGVASPASRAKGLSAAGRLAWAQGDFAAARRLHEQGLALYRQLDDQRGIANALTHLGSVALLQGDYAAARALCQHGLMIMQEFGEQEGVAVCLDNLGTAARREGDYATARLLHEQALTMYRQLNHQGGIANVLNSLGSLAFRQGDYATAYALQEDSLAIARELGAQGAIALSLNSLAAALLGWGDAARAATLSEEALLLSRQLGDKRGMAVALNTLGGAARQQGHFGRALTCFQESLLLRRETGDPRTMAESLEGLAGVASRVGHAQRATRLLANATALREAIKAPLPPAWRADYDRTLAAGRSGLGEAAFAATWAEGYAMSLEEAIAEANRVIQDVCT